MRDGKGDKIILWSPAFWLSTRPHWRKHRRAHPNKVSSSLALVNGPEWSDVNIYTQLEWSGHRSQSLHTIVLWSVKIKLKRIISHVIVACIVRHNSIYSVIGKCLAVTRMQFPVSMNHSFRFSYIDHETSNGNMIHRRRAPQSTLMDFIRATRWPLATAMIPRCAPQ